MNAGSAPMGKLTCQWTANVSNEERFETQATQKIVASMNYLEDDLSDQGVTALMDVFLAPQQRGMDIPKEMS